MKNTAGNHDMSSSIDYFECPKCGCESAYREQDNRTCEISYGCPKCSWRGEPVEKKTLKQYCKFTTGYVAQSFVKQGKKYVCVSQNFIAGEDISREDESGDPVSIDPEKEVYFPYDMKQPRKGRI
jgi:predicted RNA-binding Zn-ribbon protein involved in translation (DUF1610 family)